MQFLSLLSDQEADIGALLVRKESANRLLKGQLAGLVQKLFRHLEVTELDLYLIGTEFVLDL